MAENLTDDEQFEEIKKWWGENGSSVISGVVLGLAVLFGGKAWYAYEDRQAESASDIYAGLISSMESGDVQSVSERTGILISDYNSTPYASLGALALAKLKIEAGELEAAHAQLQWVLDNSSSSIFQDTARLRLVRVMIAEENLDGAEALLNQAVKGTPFEPLYIELRGDIAAARGELAAANKAYQEALATTDAGSAGYHLLQLKFDNTAAGEVSE